ncbi:hypothetical protein [Pseudofulvibacter geojedonensis]|uniref:Chromosome segregation protein SMC n=1 Tax=Pseudofulvibacter geojedonensis TaxID=1123758 RepID=A0ABW3I061_9FLAO
MNIKKRIILSRITIAILSLLLGGFVFYNFNTVQERKEEKRYFENEKKLFLNELNDITARYDSSRIENTLKIEEISTYKEKIKSLERKVLSSESSIKNLIAYRKELDFLKEERNRLFKIADSLKIENDSLIEERGIVENQLKVQKNLSNKLAKENNQYAEVIKKASKLQISNLNASGIRVRTTGSLSETQRAIRVERIKLSFTIGANLFAKKGDKDIYIQILDPKNNIIGDRKTIEFKSGLNLLYSDKETISYKNETLNTSILVNKEKTKTLLPGNYFISIFLEDQKLGSTSLLLK